MPARKEPTRERILDAALDLFVEQGVRGTTISDIERQVGLAAGTGSFYRHFPSKEELLRATVDREVTRCMAAVAEEHRGLPELDDPREQLAARFEQVLRDIRHFDRLLRLQLNESERMPDLQETVTEALRGSQAVGPWMDDPDVVVVIAALFGYHLFALVKGGPFEGVGQEAFIQALVARSLPPK